MRTSRLRLPGPIKNQKTLAELSQQYEINPVTISKWKSGFLENKAPVSILTSAMAERQDRGHMDKKKRDR